MQTLLDFATSKDVRIDLFPYLVLTDAIEPALCDQLVAEMPPLETLLKGKEPGNNKRFDYTIADLRSLGGTSLLWQDFVEAQASPAFWKKVVELFGTSINTLYPELEKKFGPISLWKVGHRYLDSHETSSILLDAHISVNTPVLRKPSSVREAHVDDPLKLYGALLYLRPEGDTTKGGNLQILRYKDKTRRKFFGQAIDEKYVEVVEEVMYKKNAFVFFVNSINSVHGVTPREVSNTPRYFVNLIGEMKEPLFDLQGVQENIWKRRVRSFMNTHFKEPHA